MPALGLYAVASGSATVGQPDAPSLPAIKPARAGRLEYREAMPYWRAQRERYRTMVQGIVDDARALEPLLGDPAILLLTALSDEESLADMVLAWDGGLGFDVASIDIDPDVYDRMIEVYGSDALESAMAWLCKRLHGTPIPMVASMARVALSPRVPGMLAVFDHVVFSFDESRVIGVSLSPVTMDRMVKLKHGDRRG